MIERILTFFANLGMKRCGACKREAGTNAACLHCQTTNPGRFR